MDIRREELLRIAGGDVTVVRLVDEMIELENMLDELRGLPKIKVHPRDKTKQKATPAAKMYKEYLQQYTNCVRLLMRATGADADDEISPLRRWFDEHMDS